MNNLLIPAGVILGALIGFLGQWLTAKQSRLAADEARVWERLSSLFIRLATANDIAALEYQQHADRGDFGALDESITAHLEALKRINAEVRLFASKRVTHGFVDYLSSGTDVELAIHRKPIRDSDEVFRALAAMNDKRRDLDNALRHDLGIEEI